MTYRFPHWRASSGIFALVSLDGNCIKSRSSINAVNLGCPQCCESRRTGASRLRGCSRSALCRASLKQAGKPEEPLPRGQTGRRRVTLFLSSCIPTAILAPQLPNFLAAADTLPGTTSTKTRNLSLDDLMEIIAKDISERQYFVTGNLTRSIYREDCKFEDPTNVTVGVDKYLVAVGILFDPDFSKHELLSISVVTGENGRPAILARWRLGGYLKFPWRPRVVPFTGSTRYEFDDDGLVALHDELWSISPATALLETITPSFGPKQLL